MKVSVRGIILIVIAIVFGLGGVYLLNTDLKGYSILCVAIALVSLFIGITFIIDNSSPERIYSSNVKEILNTFDSILVKSSNVPNLEGKNILFLDSIDDLVDAQLEIRKPICYVKQSESCSFLLMDDQATYIYIEKLRDDVVSPVEIEINELKIRKKSSDELDSQMIRNLEKTTIVKLSNKKSYKVSRIRDKQGETKDLIEVLTEINENENAYKPGLVIEPVRKLSHEEYLEMKKENFEQVI